MVVVNRLLEPSRARVIFNCPTSDREPGDGEDVWEESESECLSLEIWEICLCDCQFFGNLPVANLNSRWSNNHWKSQENTRDTECRLIAHLFRISATSLVNWTAFLQIAENKVWCFSGKSFYVFLTPFYIKPSSEEVPGADRTSSDSMKPYIIFWFKTKTNELRIEKFCWRREDCFFSTGISKNPLV